MLSVLSKSLVLEEICEREITSEYLMENQNLLPEQITENIETWQKIANKNYKELTNNEIVDKIKILHKYAIKDHYKNMIHEIIDRLIIEMDNSILDKICIFDIIYDIIHTDEYKSGILSHIFGFPTALHINDYIFSDKLFDKFIDDKEDMINIENINLFAKHCSLYMITKLITRIKIEKIAIIFVHAGFYNNLEIAKYIFDKCNSDDIKKLYRKNDLGIIATPILADGYIWLMDICSAAAYGGYIKIIEWAITKNIRPGKLSYELAARNGHFELLKFLHYKLPSLQYLNSIYVCGYAAKYGHFEILKWAHSKGYQLSDYTMKISKKDNEIYDWILAKK